MRIPEFSLSFREYLRLREWFNLKIKLDNKESIKSAYEHLLSLREDAYRDELTGIDDLLLEFEVLLDDTLPAREIIQETEVVAPNSQPKIVSNIIILDFKSKSLLKDLEDHAIKATLQHTKINRTKASKILGCSIRTLRNRLNKKSYF